MAGCCARRKCSLTRRSWCSDRGANYSQPSQESPDAKRDQCGEHQAVPARGGTSVLSATPLLVCFPSRIDVGLSLLARQRLSAPDSLLKFDAPRVVLHRRFHLGEDMRLIQVEHLGAYALAERLVRLLCGREQHTAEHAQATHAQRDEHQPSDGHQPPPLAQNHWLFRVLREQPPPN